MYTVSKKIDNITLNITVIVHFFIDNDFLINFVSLCVRNTFTSTLLFCAVHDVCSQLIRFGISWHHGESR